MVVLDDSAYFKGDGVECENIWHNSQVTFLNTVLLWFCMGRGDPHSIVALGKAVGKEVGPQTAKHTLPLALMKPEAAHIACPALACELILF